MKPTIAIDFNGTLTQHESGTFKEGELGTTIPGAIEFIRALAEKYDIVIFSARATSTRGKDAILKWVRQNSIRHLIKDITNKKEYSFMCYIDDRAISFSGPNDYPKIAEALNCKMDTAIIQTEKRSLNSK